ncbi:MAG TPA: hypothetical protein VM243_13160 [Phycisphaerae bacterium]|nr:hypothetical protein [Phycisphaerae bacterium]
MTTRTLRGVLLAVAVLTVLLLPACTLTVGQPLPQEVGQAITLAASLM